MVVLVPLRADPVRARLWRRANEIWRGRGFTVVTGDNEGPFRKGAAINAAAAAAGDWDAAIIADADIVLESKQQAVEALDIAAARDRYVACHNRLIWIGEHATRIVLGGGWPEYEMADESDLTWGAVFAVSRPLFDETGGFDERTLGADWEDIAFLHACRKLGGDPLRVIGDAFHLWHGDRPRYASNKRISDEYVQARDANAIRKVIEERAGKDPVV